MARILLFSDVHVSQRHCQRLVEMSAEADFVIGAGDFGSVRRGLGKAIDWLSRIQKPTVLVPGNAESFEELREACKNWNAATVLHGSGTYLHGNNFFGIGGGIPVTPFGDWSYDFTETEATDLLKDCPDKCILVSHSPPYGVLDVSSRGAHLGSSSVLKVIEEKLPRLVVCGHIHESAGTSAKIGNTVVVNAGPRGMWYDLST